SGVRPPLYVTVIELVLTSDSARISIGTTDWSPGFTSVAIDLRCTITSVDPSGVSGASGWPWNTMLPVNGSELGPKKPAGIGFDAKSSCVAPPAGVVKRSIPGATLQPGSAVVTPETRALLVHVAAPAVSA